LLGLVTAVGGASLQLYERAIVPSLHAPPVPSAPRGVPAADRDAVERFQRANDLLGEAVAYRDGKRQDWADERLAEVLALDPENPIALLLQEQWAATPPPPLTQAERMTREREVRRSELLGAAASLKEAGLADEAALLLEEAAALG
jgi:hypothetical protein